jgi:anaerobic ribonucleoside-triphosphate reductase activating protein
MRYAAIKENDVVDGKGITVSFWCQGCPFHCVGCHNEHTWDFNGGLEEDKYVLIDRVISLIDKNNVDRNLSILGGEPLCDPNKYFVADLIRETRKKFPNITIYLWTGNTLENLQSKPDGIIEYILSEVDVLIDGPFILEQRNIQLELRGSENQRVLKRGVDF